MWTVISNFIWTDNKNKRNGKLEVLIIVGAEVEFESKVEVGFQLLVRWEEIIRNHKKYFSLNVYITTYILLNAYYYRLQKANEGTKLRCYSDGCGPLIFLPGENLFLMNKIDLQSNHIFLIQSPLILFQST